MNTGKSPPISPYSVTNDQRQPSMELLINQSLSKHFVFLNAMGKPQFQNTYIKFRPCYLVLGLMRPTFTDKAWQPIALGGGALFVSLRGLRLSGSHTFAHSDPSFCTAAMVQTSTLERRDLPFTLCASEALTLMPQPWFSMGMVICDNKIVSLPSCNYLTLRTALTSGGPLLPEQLHSWPTAGS